MPQHEGQGNQGGQTEGMTQGLRQGVENVSHRLREGYDSARGDATLRYRQAEGMIARNPGSSVLIGFGIGFGIGLALTAVLGHDEETWADRYLPDSLRDAPDSIRKSRLAGNVRNMGGSVQDSLEQVTETLRDLPSTIARLLPHR